MSDLRRISIAAGLLFLVADAAGVSSVAILGSLLGGSDFLTGVAGAADRVALSAALVTAMGLACAGVAVAMYPLLRQVSPGLAIGVLAFRVIEGVVFVFAGLALLALIPLGQDAAAGTIDPIAARPAADLLRALHAQTGPLATLPFGIAAFLYYVAFWVWRLTPRWLAGWGAAAIAIYFATGLGAIVTRTGFDSLSALLMPLAVQEVVFAVWLIVRGFNPAVGERGVTQPTRAVVSGAL